MSNAICQQQLRDPQIAGVTEAENGNVVNCARGRMIQVSKRSIVQ